MNVNIPLFKRSNSNVLNMAQFFHKQIMPHFLKVAWAIEKFRKKDRYRRTLLHFLKHKKPRNNRVGHPKIGSLRYSTSSKAQTSYSAIQAAILVLQS